MKTEELLIYSVLLVAVLLATVIFVAILLPLLRRLRAGQPILKIGPVWHMAKEGTPTMGGLAFMSALLLVFVGYAAVVLWQGRQKTLSPLLLVVLLASLCGFIGFWDDYLKLTKKQNEGLAAAQKFFLQLLASSVFLFLARYLEVINTAIHIPFWDRELELGFFYYPLALIFLTGFVNALNLTDGLDGLLSGNVAVLGGFFVLYGALTRMSVFLFFGVLLLGMTVGFLLFNHHPAKIFMGDTGSLFLGGLVGGVGLISARPLTVLGMGGVFVIEAVSVILQVLYFKLSDGKRLFLMAPLHHHFEKKGLKENAIVGIFSAATALFSCLMLLGG